MSENEKEENCCIELGRLEVCVYIVEDMGKKRISVKYSGKSEWFENVEDLEKYLRKMGVAKNKIKRVLQFVNTKFRSIKRIETSIGVKGKVGPVEVGVEKGEDKEV